MNDARMLEVCLSLLPSFQSMALSVEDEGMFSK